MTPLAAAAAAAIALLAGILAGMVWPASAMARDMAAPASAQDAPIAMLVDAGNGQILFEREADRRFVPASITKVMTLYTAFEQIDEGTLDPERVITMPENVWRDWRGRGSTMWINLGDNVPARDLLLGIANVSANDASVLLAQAQAGSVENWLDAMNAQARDLGMANSHFGTPNGWPDAGATFTTARDLVTLAGAIPDAARLQRAHAWGPGGSEVTLAGAIPEAAKLQRAHAWGTGPPLAVAPHLRGGLSAGLLGLLQTSATGLWWRLPPSTDLRSSGV